MSIGGHHSRKMLKDEWLTPPEIIKALGPFDLDPCSPIIRPWNVAKTHYTIEDNGLQLPWNGYVWLNPPYGNNTERWLNRLALHCDGMALIFARTETNMFVEHVWNKANAVKFIHGRLHFYHVDGSKSKNNSGAPSVLVAYGKRATYKLKSSEIAGTYIELKNPYSPLTIKHWL